MRSTFEARERERLRRKAVAAIRKAVGRSGIEGVAEFVGRHARTVEMWCAGTHAPSRFEAQRILTLYAGGAT